MIELMCDEECAATRHCLHTVEEKDRLLDLVNCGGLAHPTDYCYAVCKTIFLFYTDLKENDKLHTDFLLKQHNCEIFIRFSILLINHSPFIPQFALRSLHLCSTCFVIHLP